MNSLRSLTRHTQSFGKPCRFNVTNSCVPVLPIYSRPYSAEKHLAFRNGTENSANPESLNSHFESNFGYATHNVHFVISSSSELYNTLGTVPNSDSLAVFVSKLLHTREHSSIDPSRIAVVAPDSSSLRRFRGSLDLSTDLGETLQVQEFTLPTFIFNNVEISNQGNEANNGRRAVLLQSWDAQIRFLCAHLHQLGFENFGPWAYNLSEREFCFRLLQYLNMLQRASITPMIYDSYAVMNSQNQFLEEISRVYTKFTKLLVRNSKLTPEFIVLKMLEKCKDDAEISSDLLKGYDLWITPDLHKLSPASARLINLLIRSQNISILDPPLSKYKSCQFLLGADIKERRNESLRVDKRENILKKLNLEHEGSRLVYNLGKSLEPHSVFYSSRHISADIENSSMDTHDVSQVETAKREECGVVEGTQIQRRLRAIHCDTYKTEVNRLVRWFVEDCSANGIVVAVPNGGVVLKRLLEELKNVADVLSSQNVNTKLSYNSRWRLDFLSNNLVRFFIAVLELCESGSNESSTLSLQSLGTQDGCSVAKRLAIETESLYTVLMSPILPTELRLGPKERNALDLILARSSESNVSLNIVLQELVENQVEHNESKAIPSRFLEKVKKMLSSLDDIGFYADALATDYDEKVQQSPTSLLESICLESFIKFELGSNNISNMYPSTQNDKEYVEIMEEFVKLMREIAYDTNECKPNDTSKVMSILRQMHVSTSIVRRFDANQEYRMIDPPAIEILTYEEILQNANFDGRALALIGLADSVIPGRSYYSEDDEYNIPKEMIDWCNSHWIPTFNDQLPSTSPSMENNVVATKALLSDVLNKFPADAELYMSYAKQGYSKSGRKKKNPEIPSRFLNKYFENHVNADTTDIGNREISLQNGSGSSANDKTSGFDQSISPVAFVQTQMQRILSKLCNPSPEYTIQSTSPILELNEERIRIYETCPKMYEYAFVHGLPAREASDVIMSDLAERMLFEGIDMMKSSIEHLDPFLLKNEEKFREAADDAWEKVWVKHTPVNFPKATLSLKPNLKPIFLKLASKYWNQPYYNSWSGLKASAWLNSYDVLHGFRGMYSTSYSCRLSGTVHRVEVEEDTKSVNIVRYTCKNLSRNKILEAVENDFSLQLAAWALSRNGEHRIRVDNIVMASLTSGQQCSIPVQTNKAVARIENNVRNIIRGFFPPKSSNFACKKCSYRAYCAFSHF